MQGNEHFKQLQQQLSTVLTQAIKKIQSRLKNLQKQVGSSEESEAIQKQADMLTANIYRYCRRPPLMSACTKPNSRQCREAQYADIHF